MNAAFWRVVVGVKHSQEINFHIFIRFRWQIKNHTKSFSFVRKNYTDMNSWLLLFRSEKNVDLIYFGTFYIYTLIRAPIITGVWCKFFRSGITFTCITKNKVNFFLRAIKRDNKSGASPTAIRPDCHIYDLRKYQVNKSDHFFFFPYNI